MLATRHLVSNPAAAHLRLGELYTYLFNKKLENEHNALADARATAECFYELLRRGEITEEKIVEQQTRRQPFQPTRSSLDKIIPVLIIILLILLLAFIYGQTITDS
jgi:DNA polymerase-3 subunit epsilon